MTSRRVLDASAVIAWVFEEDGGELVETLFADGLMSTVNYAEVIQRLIKRGEDAEDCVKDIEATGITVIDAGQEAAIIAARLSQHRDLSLADRFCIALGDLAEAPVVTADRYWATLQLPVQVELIR